MQAHVAGQDARAEGAWLVAGLGNPGPEYAGQRHNAGALVLDHLAERSGGRFRRARGRAEVLQVRIGAQRVVLVKPTTYVNESGSALAGVTAYHRIPVDRVVVVHDELDLPFGALRVKAGGGDNGHNGLRSVRRSLSSGEFLRVRVGIGRPPGRIDPADFVLRAFSATERKELPLLVDRAADAVEAVVTEGLLAAQNRFNS